MIGLTHKRQGGAIARYLAVAALSVLGISCSENPDDLHVRDDVAAVAGVHSRSVSLYFASATAQSLSAERREITSTGSTREAFASSILEELGRGPILDGGTGTIPDGFRFHNVFFDDLGGFFINIDGSSLGGGWGSYSEMVFVRSIVRTVGESFPEVRWVRFLVDGERVSSIAGHIDARHPFEVAEWR